MGTIRKFIKTLVGGEGTPNGELIDVIILLLCIFVIGYVLFLIITKYKKQESLLKNPKILLSTMFFSVIFLCATSLFAFELIEYLSVIGFMNINLDSLWISTVIKILLISDLVAVFGVSVWILKNRQIYPGQIVRYSVYSTVISALLILAGITALFRGFYI